MLSLLSFFSDTQQLLVLLSFALLCISTLLFLNNNKNLSLLILLGASFLLYINCALGVHFLWPWDERFHALVAKNMISHPFFPMLISDQLFATNTGYWSDSHLWLHKQPLFMWQMAITMKLFGINEFGLRLPSVIMASLIPLVVYRIGKLILNETAGFIAAVLCAYSYFAFMLASGQEGMDHNDLAFTFYIALSIWTWIEYRFSNKRKWAIACGALLGAAILIKWLTALVVFGAWGLDLILNSERRNNKKQWINLSIAVFFCVVVFLPWQLYVMHHYPVPAALAYEFNTLHVTEALEGHTGHWWYHIRHLGEMFGTWTVLLIIPGVIILYYTVKPRTLGQALLCIPLVVFIFFGIAKTKVVSHVFFVMPIYFLAIAAALYHILNLLKKIIKNENNFKLIFVLLILTIAFFGIDFHHIKNEREKAANTLTAGTYNHLIFEQLKKELPEGTVVFNMPYLRSIEMRFYTDLLAYTYLPSHEKIEEIKKNGYKIAVLTNNTNLPPYITADSAIKVLDITVR